MTSVRIHEQQLRHPFGTSRGIHATIPTVLVELENGGRGEGSPVRYKGQTAPQVAADVRRLIDACAGLAPHDIEGMRDTARRIPDLASAAVAAVDIAMHDALAREAGMPLHRMLGIAAPNALVSSFTIGLDELEVMRAKATEAGAWPVLKVKLGRGAEFDLSALRAVREAAPRAELRADANAAWTAEEALSIIPQLADMGVTLVEQPLRIGDYEGLAALRGRVTLPIVADEDVQGLASLPALMGLVDAINIKLMKCGGIAEARAMFAFARAQGWRVLLGCMVETSRGIAAAAHLAALADWHDLDGALLSSNDPAGSDWPAEPWRIGGDGEPGLCRLALR